MGSIGILRDGLSKGHTFFYESDRGAQCVLYVTNRNIYIDKRNVEAYRSESETEHRIVKETTVNVVDEMSERCRKNYEFRQEII